MTREHAERRTYRKSPGRQYEYEYDPLRNQNRSGRRGASTPGGRGSEEGGNPSRAATSSGSLSQRPDPRRTRQLLRQNILAGKSRFATYDEEDSEAQEIDPLGAYRNRGPDDRTLYSNRYLARNNQPSQTLQRQYPETHTEEELISDDPWQDEEPGYADPDLGYGDEQDLDYGYEEGFDQPLDLPELPVENMVVPRPNIRRTPPGGYLPQPAAERDVRRSVPLQYDEDEEEYEYEDVPSRSGKKKKGLTRRKLLWGAGAVLVGGGAIAAYEYGPKLPQALNQVGTNVEHQIADAFNKGFNAGADAVRKDFINALEDMEGVSLNVAMGATKLMRDAYDVFVSPLVTLAATVTGDFLNVTLRAFMQARHWLANIGQDNSTLAALQTVLTNWTKQVNQMPKQLQAITDADLDGAQSYLRGVQRKIDAEKAKLNSTTTPTPAPAPTQTSGNAPH